MKFALRINDLDGMTVGRLRELLEGLADENAFAIDRSYDISGAILDDSMELIIEGVPEIVENQECKSRSAQ